MALAFSRCDRQGDRQRGSPQSVKWAAKGIGLDSLKNVPLSDARASAFVIRKKVAQESTRSRAAHFQPVANGR